VSSDTEGAAAPVDPLAALEKTTNAQNHLTNVEAPRLESLQSMSEHYNADPYALSSKVRKRFREVKKVEQRKQRADDHIKGRYGLPVSLTLLEEDEAARQEAKEEWARGQRELAAEERNKRRKLGVDIVSIPSSSSKLTPLHHPKPASLEPPSKNPIDSLRARILENTARQTNPFSRPGKPRAGTGVTSPSIHRPTRP
jgi:coiled-coil domain-containing protein 130